ncbi:MAG: hypothetical protein ACK53Y_24075, partial [bacterium]
MKPQGLPRHDSSNNSNSTFDRAAHQKKVKEWFYLLLNSVRKLQMNKQNTKVNAFIILLNLIKLVNAMC